MRVIGSGSATSRSIAGPNNTATALGDSVTVGTASVVYIDTVLLPAPASPGGSASAAAPGALLLWSAMAAAMLLALLGPRAA